MRNRVSLAETADNARVKQKLKVTAAVDLMASIIVRCVYFSILLQPFKLFYLVVENSSGGSRLPTTASVKENTLAEGVSKATVTVSTTGNQSNASTGHSQPREQRNRFEKANGGRKPMNDVKTRDEPLNGTAT